MPDIVSVDPGLSEVGTELEQAGILDLSRQLLLMGFVWDAGCLLRHARPVSTVVTVVPPLKSMTLGPAGQSSLSWPQGSRVPALWSLDLGRHIPLRGKRVWTALEIKYGSDLA